MSKLKGLAWIGVTAGLAVVAAVGLPRLARHLPWSTEERLAALVPVPAGTVCDDPAGEAALARLRARLYPQLPDDAGVPLRVAVIHGDTVNAYASLGGRVYVYEGLLREAASPEELAGVLAHEIEHVRRRHVIQGAVVSLGTWASLQAVFGAGGDGLAHTLLTLGFSREQETEADEGGLARLRRGQVDAAGFAAFFERAGKSGEVPAILSSHPSGPERARRAAAARGYPTRPVLDDAGWTALRDICSGSPRLSRPGP